jgi:DNA-directed RNA polymerase specialized sigma24 family protein
MLVRHWGITTFALLPLNEEGTMSDYYDLCDDCTLIGRYCGGDDKAFEVLYDRHQAKLYLAIRGLLRKYGLATYLTEDVAQDVWLALLQDQANRLKHYNSTRASLQRYFEALAEQLIQQRRRARARTSRREVSLRQRDPADRRGLTSLEQVEFAEFLEDLPRQQRHFLRERMGEPPAANEPPLSAGNARVLTHRLQLKWPKYFG